MINLNSQARNLRKIFIYVLCIAVVTVLLACLSSCSTVSKTYSFEKGDESKIKGWEIYDYSRQYESANDTKISITEDGYKGKALKIESSAANDARVYKKIKVSASSIYKISVMVKTENVAESGAGANISGYNCSGRSSGVFGTTDGWVNKTVYLKTGAEQTSVDLSLGLGGYSSVSSGTAYFDELSVEKVSSVPSGAETLTITEKTTADEDTEVSIWLKLLFVVVLLGAVVYVIALCSASDGYKAEKGLKLSCEVGKLDKRDAIIMAAVTVVCGVFSFVNLGSVNGSPSSYWKAGAADEYVTVSFKESTTVSKIAFYVGIPSSTGGYSIQYLDESGTFVEAAKLTASDNAGHTDFYTWDFKTVEFTTTQIKVVATSAGLWLNELGFYKTVGDGLELAELDASSIKAEYKETETSGKAENLFDEQSDVRSVKSFLNSTYFDEIYHPRTAYEQLNGLSIYEWTHPPLGKTIISIGIAIFGMNTLGWRFMGTLFGVMLVPLMYAFGKKVFKRSEWAFVVSFLMMFDFMRLSQTRLATIDTYACFFTLAMIYFMYDYFVTKSYEVSNARSLRSLFLCGLMFGLGAASKWTCLYTGAALAILFFVAKLAEYIDCRKNRASKGLTAKKWFNNNFIYTCGICIIAFVLIPAAIYVLSYIPYMASNPDKGLIQIVLDNQERMYNYHSNLTSSHSYGSEWYTWPLSAYNIFYHNADSIAGEGQVARIMAMGNPFIWWLGIPCLIAGAYFAWRNKDKRMGVFVIGFLLQYAPWFLVNRVCFIYHYFTCVPFTIFMIVYVLKELTDKKILPKWSVWVYLGIVLSAFVWFYPALIGMPVSSERLSSMKWFSTWMF